jgi:hypothetical protein
MQKSVTEWIFSPFHKSVFRASGLGLVTIFLITSLSTIYPRPNLQQPTAVLTLTDQILGQSPLLCLGLLLLLLSLTDHVLGLGSPGERSRQGLRDRMLVRGRGLVGLVAVLYLALIPITLLQTQTLKNMSDRVLNQRMQVVESQITPISEVLNGKSQPPSLATLKETYPWVSKAEIQSIDQLKAAINKIQTNARIYQDSIRSSGHRKLLMRTLRLCSLEGIYAALTGYLWFHWPKPVVASEIRRNSKEPGLGFEF